MVDLRSSLDSSLDSSLRRSLSLGLDVLERASRRRVDWAQHRDVAQGLNTREETPAQGQQRSAVELKEAFSSISRFMAQTSLLCQRYHGSCCSLSDSEQAHVWRFHCSSAERRTAHSQDSQLCEDFYVEVSPGTYSITASVPESPRQQTQLVTLGNGESVHLTFDL